MKVVQTSRNMQHVVGVYIQSQFIIADCNKTLTGHEILYQYVCFAFANMIQSLTSLKRLFAFIVSQSLGVISHNFTSVKGLTDKHLLWSYQ